MFKKFGALQAETWQSDLKKGFDECWRILEDYGALIFKWNDAKTSFKEITKIFGREPTILNTLRKKDALGATFWAIYIKIPDDEELDEFSKIFDFSDVNNYV